MKRFYKDVAVVPYDGGFAVRLDERPVRTPGRAVLLLPNPALAQGVADEWRGQGEEIDPGSMRFTGLANAAIDHIAPNQSGFAAGIAQYGTTDLLCYRAAAPQALVARQAAVWDPLVAWARSRYDVTLRVTQGVMHVEQPAGTLERLGAVVAAIDPFTLAGLSTLVTLTGSLVCGLAIVEGAYSAETVWEAAEIDEAWQTEQWGEDAEAVARATGRRADFVAACAFCTMAAGRR